MAENVNGQTTWLASGGHQWLWDSPAITRKEVGSAGLKGAFDMTTAVGARAGAIAGKDGAPGLLTGTGNTRALADAALSTYEATIEQLIESGDQVSWEDDTGRYGYFLRLLTFRRVGPRHYGKTGSTYSAWRYYLLQFVELSGGW